MNTTGKTLTKEQKIELLQKWRETYRNLDSAFDNLGKVVGSVTDSQLGNAAWSGFDEYTKALAILLGDSLESLCWYCYDNQMGAKKMEAKAGSWKKFRKIKTLENLLLFIES